MDEKQEQSRVSSIESKQRVLLIGRLFTLYPVAEADEAMMSAYIDATAEIPLPWLAMAFDDFTYDAGRVFLPSIAEIMTRVAMCARRTVLHARGFEDKKSTENLDVRRWIAYVREKVPEGPQQVPQIEAQWREDYARNHGQVTEKALMEAGFSERIPQRRRG